MLRQVSAALAVAALVGTTGAVSAQAAPTTPTVSARQGAAAAADPCDAGRNARGWNWTTRLCRTANWMGRVYAHAPNARLTDMLLPGTHDSGAYAIRDRAPCAPQVIAGAGAQFVAAAQQNPCAAAALAKAQDRDLGQQLRNGVRYLDIRVGVPADEVIPAPEPPAPDPLAVPLVMQHNYVSAPLATGLRQMLRFATQHPREVVILDFQHIDLTEDPAINAYYQKALIGVLRQLRVGSESICSRAWTPASVGATAHGVGTKVPIRRAWRTDRNILVLMDSALPARSCYYDRDLALVSPWPNTDVPAVSKKDNDGYLAERGQRLSSGRCTDADGAYWCGLFVNQLQLTPSVSRYVGCIWQNTGDPCSLAGLAALVNDRVAGYMTRWTKQGEPTNINIVDFYERSAPDIVDRMIHLNRMRID